MSCFLTLFCDEAPLDYVVIVVIEKCDLLVGIFLVYANEFV